MLNRTIKIGTVTLTLGLNDGRNRYEGFTKNLRVLISQDPWGTWKACLVKKDGKGSIISVAGEYEKPEEAGQELFNEIIYFRSGINEFLGK